MNPMLVLTALATLASTQPGVAAGLQHRGHHALLSARAHQGRDRRVRVIHANQEPLGSGAYNPYADYTGPGSAVLNATVRAAGEPGVTLELAPDAKETATGGPVGGPPGFDGS